MEQRRQKALEALQDFLDAVGPITDQTRHAVREPLLDLVDQVYAVGEELKAIRFDAGASEPR